MSIADIETARISSQAKALALSAQEIAERLHNLQEWMKQHQRIVDAAPAMLEALLDVREFFAQTVPDGGKEVSVALRLAGIGGLGTAKRVNDAIALTEVGHANQG